MSKLILLSLLVATIALPVLAARDPSAVRGMKRVVAYTVTFNLVYAAALLTLVLRGF